MWQHLRDNGIKLPDITSKKIDEQVKPVLREMEKVGVKIDIAYLNKLAEKSESETKSLEKKIYKLCGEEFNLNSPIQMAEVLFEKLKLPTQDLKKTKNGFSTAASELKKLMKTPKGAPSGHKTIKYILEYRELSKLLTTYLKPLPLLADENGRLHTTYLQETTTGRLSSVEPNLQNIPIRGERGAEIRRVFIAEKGMSLISADYSQIELRVVACLADDKVMKEAFLKGEDIHAKTASQIFNKNISKVTSEERRIAKTVNFGVLYGMSPYGLSQALGIDQGDAAEYIKRYFEAHKGIKNYCNEMINQAHEEGYVETLFGFKRVLPNISSPNFNIADSEERMAINTPVQGTAAEILKIAMINLDGKLKKTKDARLLLTIHDELVVEVADSKIQEVSKIIKKEMEEAVSLCVPIISEVKAGKNWGEMKMV